MKKERLTHADFIRLWSAMCAQNKHALCKEKMVLVLNSFGFSTNNGLFQSYRKANVIRKGKGYNYLLIDNSETAYKAYIENLNARKKYRTTPATHVPFTYFANSTYPTLDLHY